MLSQAHSDGRKKSLLFAVGCTVALLLFGCIWLNVTVTTSVDLTNVDLARAREAGRQPDEAAEQQDLPASTHTHGFPAWNTAREMTLKLRFYDYVKLKPGRTITAQYPVLPEMIYWETDEGVLPGSAYPFPDTQHGKTISFEADYGGWNNIRMGFEVVLAWAVLTGRTLVLPPASRWYLLDWGLPKRLSHSGGGSSKFGDFIDLVDLSKAVSLLTSEEYVALHQNDAEFPPDLTFTTSFMESAGQGGHPLLKHWRKGKLAPTLQHNLMMYPSEAEVIRQVPSQVLRNYGYPGRNGISPSDWDDDDNVHCPMWADKNYRFFGQVGGAAVLADNNDRKALNRFRRNQFHYRPEIVYAASLIVRFFGSQHYSAIHVRRGDLQYASSFIHAQQTLDNIQTLLTVGEILYVATDEEPEFFEPIRAAGFTVYTLRDFLPGGEHEAVLGDLTIHPKVTGMIEQTVCSHGRLFFGTRLSTFTAYIHRLRGYNNAIDDHNVYYHVGAKYTGGETDLELTHSRLSGGDWGREYALMWELHRRRLLAVS